MLYVHGADGRRAAGRGRPGRRQRRASREIYDEVAQDAARFHGPYRVVVTRPTSCGSASRARPRSRCSSASGDAAAGRRARRCRRGHGHPVARSRPAPTASRASQFTPKTPTASTITAKTEPIASTLPLVYTPTSPAAAVNGQRLAAPDSQTVTGSAKTAAFKAQALVASVADPAEITLGETVRDKVTLKGVDDGLPGRRDRAALRPVPLDRRDPLRRRAGVGGQWQANGPGEYTTRGQAAEARLVRLPPGRPRHRRRQRHRVELHRPARAREGRSRSRSSTRRSATSR